MSNFLLPDHVKYPVDEALINKSFISTYSSSWDNKCRAYDKLPHLTPAEGEIVKVPPGYINTRSLSPTKNVPPIEGAYPFIPMYGFMLVQLLTVARKYAKVTPNNTWHQHLSFIDAGCGPGFTLEMAEHVGFDKCEGVELNDTHIEFGRKKGLTIHKKNIMDFDYTPFHVVYSYIPFVPFKTFTDKVMKEAKIGTIFVLVGNTTPPDEGKYETVYSTTDSQILMGTCGIVIRKVG